MSYKGYLALVLHAHLPFVRHPEHNFFLEEDWLYEAITETYLPLLDVFDQLYEDDIDFRITMSITPPLANMLSDELLISRYVRHLEKLIELTEKEIIRTKWLPEFHDSAIEYNRRIKKSYTLFTNKYEKNLIKQFKRFQDVGKLEIITSGATHGFLPLLRSNKNTVRAQVQVGVADYREKFGRNPRGIWNGECGYYLGLEDELAQAGINYFFVDAHGIIYGKERPVYGVFAPIVTPPGVAAFGRDIESSRSVWSARDGYPGDPNYREFYRDIGFDLDLDYIQPYIDPAGIRINTGIKYYRITGEPDKQPYNFQNAINTADHHAYDFMQQRENQIENLSHQMNRPPLIVSPYDAELFGHWWYEGPQFINFLLRKISCDSDKIKLTTPSEYLEEFPENQLSQPAFSSWGNNGFGEVWLNDSNDWIYKHLHKAADRMVMIANKNKNATGILKRALNQAARELLLVQSSDWAFIMKTNTTVQYAHKRTNDHINRFTSLYEQIEAGNIHQNELKKIEDQDNIFSNIDFKVYCD